MYILSRESERQRERARLSGTRVTRHFEQASFTSENFFLFPFLFLINSCLMMDAIGGGCGEQKLSLYPKEEIVGRNCRFLQGPLTNRETVVKIREAVNSGRQMEVEILNYRKDGIPFWNNFLMLPVHKNPRRPETSRVLYFIAIQKDISVIKFTHLAPILWGPAEVALWFQYHSDWEQFAPAVIEQNVDGRTLLERLSDELLMSLGVMTRKKREEMKAAIDELRADPDAFLARYQQPANGGKVLLKDEIGVNEDPNLVRPRLRSLWRADEQGTTGSRHCCAQMAQCGWLTLSTAQTASWPSSATPTTTPWWCCRSPRASRSAACSAASTSASASRLRSHSRTPTATCCRCSQPRISSTPCRVESERRCICKQAA